MKRSSYLLALPIVVLLAAHACTTSTSTATVEGRQSKLGDNATQQEMLAYGVGLYLGEEVREGLVADGVEADLDLVTRGFTDGLHDRKPMLARDDLDQVLRAVHQEMQKRMVARLLETDPNFRKLHDDNLAASRAFLEARAKEDGVQTLPGGIQYKVLARGSGRSPTITDTVVVRYRGTLKDGSEFGQQDQAVLHVRNMMEGSSRAIRAMRVGDHWEVALPPELAFGEVGNSPLIGPNEVLLFDVELLEVRPSQG